jgi:Uma2 family endonuclease
MAYGARKQDGPATLADIEALPEGVVGEIIDGTLYVHARPGDGHIYFRLRLFSELDGPFQLGANGPGGWWLMVEPGVQVEGSPEFIPDLAGWRRERVPVLPEKQWTSAPDWACEVLSPSTRGYDRRIKRPFYARIGVQHLWFVDLEERTLSVNTQVNGFWMETGVYGEDDTRVRVAPFEDVELRLGWLWQSVGGKR